MSELEIDKSKQPAPIRQPDVLSAMRDEMDRVFQRFEHGWPSLPSLFGGTGAAVLPALDVRDDGNALVIEADLPGVDEKDVAVTLTSGTLTIKGEKKSERKEEKDNYVVSERSFGTFQRAIALPDTIDEDRIEAHFEKGVLKVVAPKRADAVKSQRTIAIKAK